MKVSFCVTLNAFTLFEINVLFYRVRQVLYITNDYKCGSSRTICLPYNCYDVYIYIR